MPKPDGASETEQKYGFQHTLEEDPYSSWGSLHLYGLNPCGPAV